LITSSIGTELVHFKQNLD